MSILTKKERDGLEEVFLSISNPPTVFEKSKKFFSHLRELFVKRTVQKNEQSGKTVQFRDFMGRNLSIFSKLKKILSK